MMRLQTWIGVLALAGLAWGCSKKEEEELDFKECDCGNVTVELIDDLVGQVRYNNDLRKYGIHWAIPGTIDSKKVYFMCKVPSQYKQEGVRVRFSGKAKNPCDLPTNGTGSQQYFDIELTELALE